MDELEFRRRLYAEPDACDDEIAQFAKDDPEKQQFIQDIQLLDKQIEAALNIEVPDTLADRLILNQTLNSHRAQKKKQRVHLALAASVAFCFSLLINYTLKDAPLNVEQHALAHVYHELKSLEPSERSYELAQVNTQLASFGGKMSRLPGKISYATICDFEGQKGLHLVFQSEQGPVTLFIVPAENSYEAEAIFNDKRFDGSIHQTNNANMIMLGNKGQQFTQYQKELADSIVWEI